MHHPRLLGSLLAIAALLVIGGTHVARSDSDAPSVEAPAQNVTPKSVQGSASTEEAPGHEISQSAPPPPSAQNPAPEPTKTATPQLTPGAPKSTPQVASKISPAAASKQPACDRENFRLIIDVGHSAEVPGALSARGIGEYTFNLNLARVVERKMIEAGFTKTYLMITSGKAYASLATRVSVADRTPADLFLSIHHDAVPDKFLEKWTYEGRAHNYCDRFKGHSIFVSRFNPDYKSSLQFARLVGLQLKSRGMIYTPHYVEKFMGIRQRELVDAEAGVYRFDNLIVLMSTTMPAVLLEAGSIINRDEELVVSSRERQELVATAVTSAVEAYCKLQGPRKPEQRVARRAHATAPAATVTPPAPPFLFPIPPFIGTQQ